MWRLAGETHEILPACDGETVRRGAQTDQLLGVVGDCTIDHEATREAARCGGAGVCGRGRGVYGVGLGYLYRFLALFTTIVPPTPPPIPAARTTNINTNVKKTVAGRQLQ
ncbi:uncharacterized protein BP5553_04537 [Venustampulla echinocandica]|uniref:Uncharacterized protein n=1 Tax=Venustampulla echinocandica TaxID=2656787 RepID=A0A370TNL2_9HELO|nr:uncharacterized protein BP5553_04537 [Venustampulla echinocandica]RDL37104.1 hypothetical protein BP5553_04537 [Venustampulla echinocandica]